jgi:sugar lactone lactonase YvrE
MATDGKHLFVADWRAALIQECALEDGKVGRTLDAPTLKPCGLAYADGRLYVCDDRTGWVFVLNLANGIVERSFEAPDKSATGLALADGALFILAGDKIYKVLPDDGTILAFVPSPDPACRHLAHDGRYLWTANRMKDEFYMLDPASGKVIAILAAPGPYPAGLAWLDGHLWNVDFQTRQVNQIAVAEPPMYRLSETRRSRVEYLWALSNYGPHEVTELTLGLAVPMELPNQKLLTPWAGSARMSRHGPASENQDRGGRPLTCDVKGQSDEPAAPTKTAPDRWGQQCAVYELGPVPAGRKVSLTYSVNVEISAIRYLIIPEKVGPLADIPADVREKFTADGSHYLIGTPLTSDVKGTPYLRETVQKVVGDERNPYWIFRKIYDFLIERLSYEMIGGWDVPEVVLKRGTGSCSEYTYTFIALCRAAGLPARYQGSIVVRGDDASIDDAFHRWAQVYLPGYGWVPVDVSGGDSPSPVNQARGIGELANRFLITTQGGGDSEYLGWNYNGLARYKTNGYCKIEEDVFGFWEPLAPSPTTAPTEGVGEGEAPAKPPSAKTSSSTGDQPRTCAPPPTSGERK